MTFENFISWMGYEERYGVVKSAKLFMPFLPKEETGRPYGIIGSLMLSFAYEFGACFAPAPKFGARK